MISTAYVVAIAIGCLFLGWLLQKLMKGDSAKEWEEKYTQLDKEFKSQTKLLNKETKQKDQFRQKSESWKQEYQALTVDTQRIKKDHLQQLNGLNEQSSAYRAEAQKEKTEKDRAETSLAKAKKDLEKLREKYTRDVASGSDWRSERQKMERELKTATDRLNKTTVIADDYKSKYAAQAAEISKIRVMEREIRVLNTKLKKFEEDISYWEKKHYDTHHELAALKELSKQKDAKYKELDELRKGDQILKDNLLNQIQEFKTKFVNINNKYRDLVSNN